MSETEKKPTTRRALMGNAGIAALIGMAAMAIAGSDARAVEVLPTAPGAAAHLIALHDQFMVLQVQIDAINAHLVEISDKDLDDISAEQAQLLDAMSEHIASTPAGHRARVLALAAWYGLSSEGNCPSVLDEKRVWPVFRDLIGASV